MRTKSLFFIILPILLIACHAESSQPTVWNLLMERKGFECLRTEGEKIRSALEMTEENLSGGDDSAVRQNLINAKKSVRTLLDYEVPVIEARQMIYDAWWLYTVGRIEEMNRSLGQANNLFSKIREQGDTPFYSQFGEIQGQIRHIEETVEIQFSQIRMRSEFQGPYSVAAQFQQLVEKVDTKVFNPPDQIN